MLSEKITTRYGEEITDLLLHMIDYTPDGLVTVNGNHQIMMYNQGAEQMFGYRPDEVLDQSVDMLVPDHMKTILHHQLQEFADTHSAVCDDSDVPSTNRMIAFGLRKSDEEFPCETTITKIRFKDQEYLILAIEDITERLRHEKELATQKINKRAELILQVTEEA